MCPETRDIKHIYVEVFPTHTHPQSHTHTHVLIHTHTHNHTHIYTCTHTRTHIHTRTHARTHTFSITHTHTLEGERSVLFSIPRVVLWLSRCSVGEWWQSLQWGEAGSCGQYWTGDWSLQHTGWPASDWGVSKVCIALMRGWVKSKMVGVLA